MFKIILLPVLATLIAQSLKFVIKSNGLKFNWQNLLAYSGMPSSHAAIVLSLATIIGLEQGWSSPLFGFAFIFAFLIIRDALGLRQYLGHHGKILNVLIKELKTDKLLDKSYPKLLERIGHTPKQVLVGGIIGIVVSMIGYYFL
ncbi:MAG: divergent PAP2 family protein [Candidatus Falkowbacteria bacterium]